MTAEVIRCVLVADTVPAGAASAVGGRGRGEGSSGSTRVILCYEELLRIARAAVGLGVEKVRVTGGEPLVRKGVVSFLAQLAEVPGLTEIALTTNGVLLA